MIKTPPLSTSFTSLGRHTNVPTTTTTMAPRVIKHIKFRSIKPVGRTVDKFLIKNPEAAKDEWIVTEKVDGANYCIIYDGKSAWGARRNAILSRSETFYNHEEILASHSQALAYLYEYLAVPPGHVIRVYGELLGNWYPHKEVQQPDINTRRVHKCKTAYSPRLAFIAFDITIDAEDGTSTPYSSYSACLQALHSTGFTTVPILAQGPLVRMMSHEPYFITKIPGMLGLPPITQFHNIAEGVVITQSSGVDRVRFKSKHCGTQEVKPRRVKRKASIFNTHLEDASRYLTVPRLQSVRSKCLPAEHSDHALICDLLVKDALRDYMRDPLEDMSPAEQIQWFAQYRASAMCIIQEHAKMYNSA